MKKNFLILGYLISIMLFSSTQLFATEHKRIFLNYKENNWLDELKKPLTVGITLIPNQVLVSKNGSYKGFSIDLFHIIEKN